MLYSVVNTVSTLSVASPLADFGFTLSSPQLQGTSRDARYISVNLDYCTRWSPITSKKSIYCNVT